LTAKLEWSLIWLGALAVALAPHGMSGDGLVRYETLQALAEGGHLTASRYSIVQSVLALPLYELGKAFGSPSDWVSMFNRIVFLLGLAALYRALAGALDARERRAMILLLLSASMFPHHIAHFYGEVFTAVAVFLGIVASENRRPWLGGSLLALGTMNTPTALGSLMLLAADRAWRARKWLREFWPVALAAVAIAAENWARRGSPLAFGYEDSRGFATELPYSGQPGFSYPFFLGALSILFSFGKGLLFFVPALALAFLWQRRPEWEARGRLLRQSLLFTGGLLLVYARWWAWYGGWFWGPRFFLFACFPAALLLASFICRPPRQPLAIAFTLAVLIASLWVGLDGAVFGQDQMDICTRSAYRLEALCWYVPEFSALFRPFVAPSPWGLRGALLLAYTAAVAATLAKPLLAGLVATLRGNARASS
jgi:hypothetical protein